MSSKPSSYATALAILAILAVAGFGAYLHFVASGPISADVYWRDAVRLTPGGTAFTVAAFLAEIGSGIGVAACGAIAAALFLASHYYREAATIATALILGVAMSQLIKFLVARPRPLDALYSFDGSSYPSGHSMGAAALAISLAYAVSSVHRSGGTLVNRVTVFWMWVAAMCWTASMMWSRAALGVHWLSDTIAGALLGIAAATIAQRVWAKKRNA